MKEFWTLLKYEFRMQTSFGKGNKRDWLGRALAVLTFAFFGFVIAEFLLQILRNYFAVEIHKVSAPMERATEMLGLLYLIAIVVITLVFLEYARKVLVDDKNRLAFLRLPISQRNLFLCKFIVLTLRMYLTCALFVITINVVASLLLPVGLQFWLGTVGVCVFMPFTCLLFVTLLIIPYIKLIEMLAHRYALLFILFTGILITFFILYSKLLEIVQMLMTTGSIRFLFNENFVGGLQAVYKFAYPANAFVDIVLKENSYLALLLIIAFALISLGIMYCVNKKLFEITLYRFPTHNTNVKKPKKVKQSNAFITLIKKEFICVCREPKYIFSYLSVAMSMPIMVYCSFTLLETLIYNSIGVRINFALALTTVLLFGVLTNTFCATNVSRDGLGILKMKTLPIRTDVLFYSKVAFCAIISLIAVIVTCILLVCLTSLTILEGVLCAVIACAFTIAQILVATRIDLNHAQVSLNQVEMDKLSSNTLIKVILIGAPLSLLASVSVILFSVLSNGWGAFANPAFASACAYAVPILISVVYLLCAVAYCKIGLQKVFEKLAN